MIVLAAGTGSQAETRLVAPLTDQEDTCSYTIRKGDTLSHIAARLTGKTAYYTKIMRSNDLASETIYPGDVLRIPRQLLLPQHQCSLNPERLRSNHTETPPATRLNTNSKVLADIEGAVFEDRNGNGEYDAEEPGVSEIHVILVREGRMQTSDEEGRVLFVDVEPGEHAIGIDESSIPEGYQLRTKSTVLISVAEGDKGYVAFGIQASTVK
jgi:hypothetical protein